MSMRAFNTLHERFFTAFLPAVSTRYILIGILQNILLVLEDARTLYRLNDGSYPHLDSGLEF